MNNKNKPLPAATENGNKKKSPAAATVRDSESNQFKKPAKNHEVVIQIIPFHDSEINEERNGIMRYRKEWYNALTEWVR